MLPFEENWLDFPIGLSVLLVDSDDEFRSDVQVKLEGHSYMVTSFPSADKALTALLSRMRIFHVALMEATSDKSDMDMFKILELSRDLPIIMMSAMENMPMMVKSIAFGAVEFWVKPLSEDKLKNIWQHVVRKVLESKDALLPGYLEPGKPLVDQDSKVLEEGNVLEASLGSLHDTSETSTPQSMKLPTLPERFSEPSTPQLEQVDRLALCETALESPRSQDSSRANNCKDFTDKARDLKTPPLLQITLLEIKEEPNETLATDLDLEKQESVGPSGSNGKKKSKVGWTADLHRRFVQAVEYLGVDQAIPSRILEVMKVDGLTRHNIASHLQKHRFRHKKRLMRREVEGSNRHQHRLAEARPALTSTPSNIGWFQPCVKMHPSFDTPHASSTPYPLIYPPLHVWGHPAFESSAMHGSLHFNSSMWQHPVVLSAPCGLPQRDLMTPAAMAAIHIPKNHGNSRAVIANESRCTEELDFHPPKELLDAAINEALSNPSMPLPLGLKPPSMESVMAELKRRGVSTLFPCT